MPPTNVAKRFFAITTPGLSGTRWLAYVLASHPEVYVAHGKHALDAVICGDFQKEKETANLMSLERGNDMREFYEQHCLEEVFARFQVIKSQAKAFGCVHSYTLDSLVRSARSPKTLAQMRVLNVIRHPVNYISSHYAMVRSAEKHPRLYQLYVDTVFPQVVHEFPELFLMDCPDFRAFFAFAISCHSVANLIRDLCYPGFRTVQMEVLTTRPDALQQICEELTGLEYSRESLETFIRQGAINQHRARNSGQDPHQILASWEPWQQDMAHALIPGIVLDWLEKADYDVSMLRDKLRTPATVAAPPRTPVLCLGDYLRALDSRHPLLNFLNRSTTPMIQFIDAEQQGFDLVQHQSKVYAVARTLHTQDLKHIHPERLGEFQEQRLCVMANSVEEAWIGISRAIVASPTPQLLAEEYQGFNLIAHMGKYFAVAQSLGQVDVPGLGTRELWEHQQEDKLFMTDSATAARRWIDGLTPVLLEEGYRGFNLIAYRGSIFAMDQNLGPMDLQQLAEHDIWEHQQAGTMFVGKSATQAKQQVNGRHRPNRVWSRIKRLTAGRFR